MKWVQVDNWYWERACGRYTVCRALMFDRDARGEWVYQAWFRPAGKEEAPVLLQRPGAQRRYTFADAARLDAAPHIRAQRIARDAMDEAA